MRGSMHYFLSLVLVSIATVSLGDEARPALSEHLRAFEPYLGKTWRGEFVGSTPENPIHDVSHWERALGGQAIRILHSVNDGDYGGETVIMWDTKTEVLRFWYFTTAGFRTEGTMEFADGKWAAHETVSGNGNGVTEVRSTSELLPDGRLHTKSEYLKDGQWVDGHEIHYTEAPDAKVVFK
jgi:hypothetical protein